MNIKPKKKMEWTFGDFIAAIYQKWGASQAAGIVNLAIATRQVIFKKQPSYFAFFRQQPLDLETAHSVIGRNKIGARLALVAALVGSASFASSGFAQEVIVSPPRIGIVVPSPPIILAPPIVVAPDPGFYLFGGGYGGRFDGRRDAREYGRRGFESRGFAHHDDGGRRR